MKGFNKSVQTLPVPAYFISERRAGALYVKAVLRGGHVGAGECYEMTRYLKVKSLSEVFIVARKMARTKKKNPLLNCEPISLEEYRAGKQAEKFDPYLNTFKPKKLGDRQSKKNKKESKERRPPT